MRRILTVAALGLFLSGCGCPDTQSRPFSVTFAGPCSGTGLGTSRIWVDRLSADRMHGIVVSIDLRSEPTQPRLAEDGTLHRRLSVAETSPPVEVRVFEFSQAISGFDWYHGGYQEHAVREWVADSGHVDLRLSRSETNEQELCAQVLLSNACFVSTGGEQRRTISSVSFDNVPLDHGRE